MAQSLVLPISGLASDPGPYTAAPEGALYEATNVISRRAGVLEPRGGFIVRRSGAMGLSYHTFRFAGARFNCGLLQASSAARMERNEATQIAPPSSYSFTFTQGKTWSTIAKGRALFTSNQGVHRLDNATATTAYRAGVDVPEGFGAFAQVSGTAALNWLADTNYTAYRIVFIRYSDGTPIYSAPSNYTLVRNTQGATGFVRLRICSTFLIDTDEVQIYRSASGTSAPADEMKLRATLKITSSGAYQPNTSFTWDDYLGDSAWSGAQLYTNSTQESIALARYRPGYADDVCTYNGMTFFAGHKTPQRVVLRMADFGTTTGTNDAQAFCTRTDTGTTTSGSAVVTTGYDPSLTFFVGQVVTLAFTSGGRPGVADATFQADSRIVSFGPGNQFTMSKTATASGGVGIACWDWIACERGGDRQVIYSQAEASSTFANTTTTNRFLANDDPAAGGARGGAQDAARAWSEGYIGTSNNKFRMYWSGARDTDVTLTFEALHTAETAFTVKSTKPLAFDRYCDATTGITSTQDGGEQRLAWSPVDIPDAAPLPYYQDVVPEGESIYRAVVCRDSLWLFTSIGLYRLTGTDPDSISISPFDSTVVLAQRASLAVAHDAAWAWTYRGILRITDGGAERIDLPIARSIDGLGSSLSNPWCLASHDHAFVAFGFTTSSSNPPDWSAYVYSIKTGTWSTWSGDSDYQISSAAEGDDGELLVGWRKLDSVGTYLEGGTAYYSFYDYDVDTALASTPPASFDGRGKATNYVNVTSVVGTTVTIAAGTTYTPKVGDALYYSIDVKLFWITAVSSATQFTVHALNLGTGNVPVLESFPVSVKWVARAEGNVGVDKFWTQATLPVERLRYGVTMGFSYAGVDPQQTSTETVTYETGTTFDSAKPHIFRRLVPTSVARGWALRVGFSQQWAAAFFSTAGLHLTYRALRTKAG